MNNEKKILKNWLIWTALVFFISIQILMAIIAFPMSATIVNGQVFLFLLFLFLVGAGQILGMIFMRQQFVDVGWSKKVVSFLIVESLLTFCLLSAVIKVIFYGSRGQMAMYAWQVLLGVAVLNKIFWPQIRSMGEGLYAVIIDQANAKMFKYLAWITGTLLVALIIFVPDYQRVIARMYIGEQFHHYDIFVMAAGWAAANGHIMDVDQISQYGVGMPYVFAQICYWLGRFSYEHVFLIIMGGTMVYYVLYFWFCVRWFKSTALALIVLLLGIRMQMFHPGDYPFSLTYPSATVIRYFFDVFVFMAIVKHLRSGNPWMLIMAGIISGFSLYYIDSTGAFLIVAFYAYVFCLVLMPYTRDLIFRRRNIFLVGVSLTLPIAVAMALFYATAGNHLWTKAFWTNMMETVAYFLSGIGTYPMYENFKYHNFFAGLMGFAIPMVYVWTIIFVGVMCYLRKFSRWHIFIIVMCIYGLGVNHYYIARSVLTSYYVTALPFMFVCGYWLKLWIWGRVRQVRLNMLMAVLAVAVYALCTNHNFMAYPNIFNFSHNPMIDPLVAQPLPADWSTYFNHLYRNDAQDLKLPTNSLGLQDEELYTEMNFASDDNLVAYYKQEFDFSQDARLIESLTKPGQRVPVISDFEIKILMQANRPPFFYYFPLISNRPKHMRTMPINFLHTNAERFNSKAIDQLRAARPEYVFLEKIFLNPSPKAYADKPENIMPIIDYVRGAYVPYIVGEYIVAMKRK